eukprot:8438727-Pyramimonas_sp.AAC.1
MARAWGCSARRAGCAGDAMGAAGCALECEERDVSLGGGGSVEAFVPVGKRRLWMLKVVGGHGAVKGA